MLRYKSMLYRDYKQSYTRVWPIRSEFSLFHVEEQSILARGSRGKFLKNLFSQKLQLIVYKKHAESLTFINK